MRVHVDNIDVAKITIMYKITIIMIIELCNILTRLKTFGRNIIVHFHYLR